MSFEIGRWTVGAAYPVFVMAEVGLAHDGSIALAHAYIDAVALCGGVNAIKFQCHLAEAESWPDEPWRVRPHWSTESRYEYLKRTGFSPAEWTMLAQHAREMGLEFLCSPFSVEAVELLNPLVYAWKLASGEITNRALIGAMRTTGKPIIASTGMATWEEIRAVEADALMHCTSRYPTLARDVGLMTISRLRDLDMTRPVGLSDHTGTIYPSLAAVALGADLLEVHVTMSREMPGPDVVASITMDELTDMVEGVRFLEQAMQPVSKDEMAEVLQPMRDLFMGRAERRVEKLA